MSVISAPENIRNLDRYRQLSKRLALAEGLTDEQARALAADGKAIVWIDGGLHANEVLGAQQLIELVYQLVSRSDAETLRFLRDVIVLAVAANPDGQELVSNWYMRDRDPLRRTLDGVPRAYQKYIGHDNNRDFYLSSQAETINMNRILYKEWFPQIVYNHHQTGPPGTVMFAPPFRDPFNYVFDPLVPAGIELVGAAMQARFAAEKKPGVTMRTGSNYSTWWNGGLRTTAYFHNQIGLLTETIGSPTPTRIPFVPDTQVASNDLPYPIAPQPWHFRQSIDYSMTANRAVIDVASRYRETLLYNVYRMGKNGIERGNQDTWTVSPRRVAAVKEGLARDGRFPSDAAFLEQLHRPRSARCSRLHPDRRPAGLSDGDEVRRRAAEERRRRTPRDRAFCRGWPTLSGRLLRREDGAGVPAARARHVRAAGSSGRHSVPWRRADAAVRHRRLDAGVPDGRQVRPDSRRASRARSNGSSSVRPPAGAVLASGGAVGYLVEPSPERRLHRGEPPAGGRRGRLSGCATARVGGACRTAAAPCSSPARPTTLPILRKAATDVGLVFTGVARRRRVRRCSCGRCASACGIATAARVRAAGPAGCSSATSSRSRWSYAPTLDAGGSRQPLRRHRAHRRGGAGAAAASGRRSEDRLPPEYPRHGQARCHRRARCRSCGASSRTAARCWRLATRPGSRRASAYRSAVRWSSRDGDRPAAAGAARSTTCPGRCCRSAVDNTHAARLRLRAPGRRLLRQQPGVPRSTGRPRHGRPPRRLVRERDAAAQRLGVGPEAPRRRRRRRRRDGRPRPGAAVRARDHLPRRSRTAPSSSCSTGFITARRGRLKASRAVAPGGTWTVPCRG